MGKSKISADRILGLSAMLISLLTLIIFIYQTSLMRTQSRLSVTPRIAFSTYESANDSIVTVGAEIENKGLGPAIIESIAFVHEGKRFPLNMNKFLTQAYPDFEQYADLTQSVSLTKGSTLSPDEKSNIYTLKFRLEEVEGLLNYLNIELGENPFMIEVVYSSIYGDRWKTNNLIDDHPEEL